VLPEIGGLGLDGRLPQVLGLTHVEVVPALCISVGGVQQEEGGGLDWAVGKLLRGLGAGWGTAKQPRCKSVGVRGNETSALVTSCWSPNPRRGDLKGHRIA